MRGKGPFKNAPGKKRITTRSNRAENPPSGSVGRLFRSAREEIRPAFDTEGKRTATTVLKEDHERLAGLIHQLKSTTLGKKELVRMIEEEIKIHSECEEKIFYPQMRNVARRIVEAALEAHHQVETILAELKEMTGNEGEAFDVKVTVLEETLKHHIREEEEEMFPEAEKKLDDRLEELGAAIESLKGELTPKIRKAA